MAAFAEDERETISKRTRDALAAAKARGVQLGNPCPDMPAVTGKAAERAAIFRATVLPFVQSQRDAGMTLRAIADDLNARSMKTLNGKQWAPATVRGILLAA